jgi:predicted nucleic acid-binding protein
VTSWVLLDTDVFSFLWQAKQNHVLYAQHLKSTGATPVLGFVSVAESHFGAQNAKWGPPRLKKMAEALSKYVVVPYDDQMPVLWGKLKAEAKNTGHALGDERHTNDLWLATIAKFHNIPLMTNNVRHFRSLPGLQVISFGT